MTPRASPRHPCATLLGLVATAWAAPALAQDQELAAGRALLAALDAAWNNGDVERYLRLFASEQPVLHDAHARHIRAQLAAKGPRRRTSELLLHRQVGQHTVLRVLHHLAPDDTTAPTTREGGLVVARPQAGTLVPVLAAGIPVEACNDEDVFTCPACNYTVGGAEGWLCVPVARERAAAVEAATFVLLGTDLAVELSVQIADRAEPATTAVAALTDLLRQQILGAVVEPPTDWQPPTVPSGLADCTAARAAVDLPDGQRLVVHAVALGRLRHLLLLRGTRHALLVQADRIAALLATYRLLETDPELALQATVALRAHTGGTLDGGHYQNDHHGVHADGPPGWLPLLRCAGSLFQVVWDCPQRSGRLWLTGYGPPAGAAAWTNASADAFAVQWLRRLGHTLASARDSGWSLPDQKGVSVRTLALEGAAGERNLRLCLQPELLVVADGHTDHPAQAAAVRAAVASAQCH